ncbi:nitrous oxide reductase accessory protein NosL [Metasolibacillus sp.]|uniref:nitrous oxide reductase accessory protein NosL n=1 Tax=Metasolibacillus sp. TaxID=2703680 RepID=UPI0025CD0369|nr:nitrous oxide reductase accessory protein NosL [Metasolibacillus sp.]MCT6925432.1 nitrous oxide reductase accessory protein NosL [Metasolibacillus sp.]MCT6941541.1 nitrous oxide reductase accessory protein NosL [Metasolibacillus sp.]
MKKIILLFIMGLLLIGCSEQSVEPRKIDPETDICLVCNMGITHSDYAGQVIFKNNDYLVFDDLGCLIEYLREPEQEVAVAYIQSNDKHEWIDVKKAAYIYNEDYWTPMNYGVLAFASVGDATIYEQENGAGKALTYDELVTSFNWGVHEH